ncbi:MAG TPA: helix-turn-helix domain-containing protein, partial [Beijerinckiaceae bacterium]|nr:helix-turn-helix domain-containing protein [Beijerinckiaceae bacterium]
ARQEWADARQATLLMQSLRPELYRHAPTRGKPLALKAAAVLLYVSGLSMNRTAKLLGVSTPTIQAWLEQVAAAYAQKPEPEGRAVVIELDEMWHDLKKSQTPSGSGRLGIVLQGGWWTGNAGVVTRPLASA